MKYKLGAHNRRRIHDGSKPVLADPCLFPCSPQSRSAIARGPYAAAVFRFADGSGRFDLHDAERA